MKQPHALLLALSFGLTSVFGISCATPPSKPFLQENDTTTQLQNAIIIQYTLGHNQYTFEIKSRPDDLFKVRSLVNEKVIEEKKIAKEKYVSFANKVHEYAQSVPVQQTSFEECQHPYSILIQKDREADKTIRGCRSDDTKGALGRLIREGEILFYAE
ncbi:MAG: hypothetical protein RBT63_03875 [Bdellovibrionales bacterium]|jgi:hypothetical protein|nr:hypothetical protein [Bdellovibrionales bacterium]